MTVPPVNSVVPPRAQARTPRPPRRPVVRPVVATQDERRPDEVVVVLDQSASPAVEADIARQYNLVALNGQSLDLIQSRIQRFRIPDGRSVPAVLAAMQTDQRVASVQPNYLYRFQDGGLPGLSNAQYAPSVMRVPGAHRHAQGRNVTVAVIDSGVDEKHPVLSKLNLKVFDAVNSASKSKTKARPHAHGTGVASVLAGNGPVSGVAPQSRLLAVRAFFSEKRSAHLTTTMILLTAIDWAHRNNAKVFNLSFAGPRDAIVEKMLKAVHDKGGILLAAAGNKGPKAPTAYPAGYEHVLAVTATDDGDRLYTKANRGAHIALAAPGVDIFVATPGGGYDFKSGTSFAVPHVAGLVALLLERDPDLRLGDVRRILQSSARDLGEPGHDALFGAGRADALAAMEALGAAKTAVRAQKASVNRK